MQVEIARFADVYEAEIAASRLRADGFDAVLGGAEHAKANPLVLQALGWIRLTVPADQAEAARLLLAGIDAGLERLDSEDPADSPAAIAAPASLLGLAVLGFLCGG